MNFKQFTLVVGTLGIMIVGSFAVPAIQDPHTALLNIASRSKRSLPDDPFKSATCFNEFMPEMTAVNEEFKAKYLDCANTHLNKKKEERAKFNKVLEDLSVSINQIYTDMQACKSDKSEESMKCFAEKLLTNAKKMKFMGENAYQNEANLSIVLASYQNEEQICSVNCKHSHEDNHSFMMTNFQNCVDGKKYTLRKSKPNLDTNTETENSSPVSAGA